MEEEKFTLLVKEKVEGRIATLDTAKRFGKLYAKYDLNPLFKNNAVDQNNISLGVRFDFN